MGIYAAIRRVSPATLAEIVAAYPAVEDYDENEEYSEEMETQSFEMWRKDDDTLDLGKLWHALHFLLTGSPYEGEEPLCYLMVGGTMVGSEGWGFLRLLSLEQTAAFGEALSALSRDEFASRFDAEQMTREEIYPSYWWHELPDARLLLVNQFVDLQTFVAESAARGQGLVVGIA